MTKRDFQAKEYASEQQQSQPAPAVDGGFADYTLDGLRLVCTCVACPEQYDVFDGDEQVGYLRLRHGCFRADVPVCGGETIYVGRPEGDGCFRPGERLEYLCEAVVAIQQYRRKTT